MAFPLTGEGFSLCLPVLRRSSSSARVRAFPLTDSRSYFWKNPSARLHFAFLLL